MEFYFLILLVAILIFALTSGFPVAFALPGSAVITIALAAFFGWIIEGNPDAYFHLGGPNQWLSAGVTNYRSLYWEVERDTLIAIPLFVFMGIMLQRSKIAEDLLVAMAQLFGPIPGGLGISVVFVGALLAATTGIVGATVIAMGLISLPAMLRNNYSKSLACGTICASGTLGQIIPPSIVLIILADQLASAADQAATLRVSEYKEATGEFSMPSEFGVVSASAGDMFMGAFIPGLILVGIYMVYILVSALIKPQLAPPVPYDGNYDRKFAVRILLALIPPLTLIFIVLGSIIMGVATVNQAGAIGAIGAMMMGSYRLVEGSKTAYYPAILAIGAVLAIVVLQNFFDLNIKSIETGTDVFGIFLALIAVAVLVFAILWATWRAITIEDTMRGVMIETAKTTSMVFIILLGAAMLTSAFRAFGGEDLVKEYLTGLPGGFWTQFIVVMIVIFLLGFFLDFLEIAVVVVPIVAPILLANPEANVTAVWFGVMIGLNIQTSFLTPPFGFALFYLRGVAPKSVKTTQIYKGAVAFILLQLTGLVIAGVHPPLVNYLPNKTQLTSETAPPPSNPQLQECLEDYLFPVYAERRQEIEGAIASLRSKDVSILPDFFQGNLTDSLDIAAGSFDRITAIEEAGQALDDYAPEYRPILREVRALQREMRKLKAQSEDLVEQQKQIRFSDNPDEAQIAALETQVEQLDVDYRAVEAQIPDVWESAQEKFTTLAKAETNARRTFRSSADQSYEAIINLIAVIESWEVIESKQSDIANLDNVILQQSAEDAMETIKLVKDELDLLPEAQDIASKVNRARRALRGDNPDQQKAAENIQEALQVLQTEVSWRKQASTAILSDLKSYEALIANNIGMRQQGRLTETQAEFIASCKSGHKDLSLFF